MKKIILTISIILLSSLNACSSFNHSQGLINCGEYGYRDIITASGHLLGNSCDNDYKAYLKETK